MKRGLFWFAVGVLIGLINLLPAPAGATITVTPSAWNVIGLDSNSPAFGPKNFPVGAKVCSTTAVTNVLVTFTWDSSNPYVALRPGSLSAITIPSIGAGSCADAFFEVEVTQNAAAFDTTRQYHISSGADSTPIPREIYVEHLVSQSRNSITDVRLNGVSVPAGGSMNLIVGNTYTIDLLGGTATQGYNQFEAFINFSNTIFQILSVSTTYSANDSPYVSNPSNKLYADACLWENDPNSPYYLSCVGGDYKTGGSNVVTTYTVNILSGGGTTETLNTLLHDFSGSSFHYNSDYSTGARFANIIDPSTATISKSFSPNPTNAGGASALTFTLTNPNAAAISGLNFIDVFPTSPGAMSLSSTTTTNTCGGTLTDDSGGALAVGSAGIKLTGGVIPANSSCMVQVVVTPPATGTYSNTSNHLFVDTLDTGIFATASLTVNSTPPPPAPPSACSVPVELARWNFDNLTAGSNFTPAYSSKAADVSTATATLTGGTGGSSSILAANSQSGANSWASQGYPTTSTTTSATATYIDFVLDTSNYGGVIITYSADTTNGNWGGTNHLYSYSKADAGAFSLLTDTAGLPTAFTTYAAAAAATGTATTTFRINASGSKSNPSYSFLYLDDIIITGCSRPDPNLLTITKSFATNPVAVNGTSNLTFTITNNNAASTANLTGISFTDTLPLPALQGTIAVTNGSPTVTGTGSAFRTQLAAGSIVSIGGVSYTVSSITSDTVLTLTANYAGATAGGLSMSAGLTVATSTASACAGTNNVTTTAATGIISMTGGTLAPGASCTVTVNNVKANAAGAFQNVSGFISSTEAGTNTSSTGSAKATLTAVLPPSIAKRFAPSPILAGGVSTLTITLANPNQNNALSGVAFSDTFPVAPGAMTVAAPLTTTNTCGGAALQNNLGGVLAAGAAGIKLPSGAIPAGSSCTVTVNVTAPSTGTYNNTSGNVSHIINAATVNGNTASASLSVNAASPAIALLKQVSTSAVGPWASFLAVTTGADVYYRFTIENAGDVPLSPVSLTDPLVNTSGCVWPASLPVAVAANNNHIATCVVGPITAVAGSHLNTATASGTYGGNAYTDQSSAIYATTTLTIVKSATQTYFLAAGNILNYSYVVKNTGSASLVGPVTVADNKATVTCPAVSTAIVTATSLPGDGDNYLDPGEQITCTAAYTVVAADVTAKAVTNVASATISGVTSPTTSKTVPLAPDLTVAKTDSGGGTAYLAGTFGWTLTVTNGAGGGAVSIADALVLLVDELPTSGATYSAPATATNAGGTTGTINCVIAANTLTCTTSGVVTMPTGGSFSIVITVTPSALGSLVNPRSGGSCMADSSAVIPELDETNNNCAPNTVTVSPALTVSKTVSIISDPLNGTINPKFIPGGTADYTLLVTNSGGAGDTDTVSIIDPVPANTELFVGDLGGAGSGPVSFTDGAPASGLTYTYTSLATMADDVSFSNDGGVTYTYVPVPNGSSVDPAVTHILVNPKGVFGGGSSFTITFRVRVK